MLTHPERCYSTDVQRLESDRHKNKLLNLKCDFVFQVFFAPPQESEDVVIHCLLPSAF